MCTRGIHLSTQKWVSSLWMLLGHLLVRPCFCYVNPPVFNKKGF